MKIKVTTNGPYLVTGNLALAKQVIETDAEGQSREWRQDQVSRSVRITSTRGRAQPTSS